MAQDQALSRDQALSPPLPLIIITIIMDTIILRALCLRALCLRALVLAPVIIRARQWHQERTHLAIQT